MTLRSAAQIAASKANGAKSSGPATPEGRIRSAANSVKHGLCSKEFVLDDPAEQARFETAVAELIFNHQAVTDLQERLCRRLAIAHWRQDVCDNLEGLLWHAVQRGEACFETGGTGFPGMAAINRYRNRLARDIKEAKAELAEAKRQRAEAMQSQMTKAQELASGSMLKDVIDELGPQAFAILRDTLTNTGKTTISCADQTNPSTPTDNSETVTVRPVAQPKNVQLKSRRRAEKRARRQNRNHAR